MTLPSGGRLGIDFGTSHTVAAVAVAGRSAQPLLFDASPLLPSGVYGAAGLGLLTGGDAERAARRDPARFEPSPKRLIDDGVALLGGDEYPIVDLIAAVLGRVAAEALRVVGQRPSETVLTHPAAWGGSRRGVLTEAAGRAGLVGLNCVAEPVAAAVYFTAVLGHAVPPGAAVAVYDLGAGTFDTSVLRRDAEGMWGVLASRGLAEIGGLDLDAAIVDRIGATVGARHPDRWRELLEGTDDTPRRLRHTLWTEVRAAKEQLSRASSVIVPVPLLDVEAHLTRDEFEQLARPYLARTVELTATTIARAGLSGERLAGLFLVGGASRIPLVATLLHRRLGIAPTLIEQPELVVAQGSLLVSGTNSGTVPSSTAAEARAEGPLATPSGTPASVLVGPPHLPGPPSVDSMAGQPLLTATRPPTSPPGHTAPGPARPRSARWWVLGGLALLVVVAVAMASNGGPGRLNALFATSSGTGTAGSLPVNRTAWYAGLKLTFGTASYDPTGHLSVDLRVDNPAPSRSGLALPIMLGYRGKTTDGRVTGMSEVEGNASTSGTVDFTLDYLVSNLRDVVLTIGSGDERRAVVPFGAAAQLVDLRPRITGLSGAQTVGFLRFIPHTCEVRADIPVEHEQVKADRWIVACTVDVQLVGPTNLDYGISEEEFRLVLPDGTTVAPAKAIIKSINPMQLLPGLTASFTVPEPVHGTYTLQLRDPGRTGTEPPSAGKIWNVPVTLA